MAELNRQRRVALKIFRALLVLITFDVDRLVGNDDAELLSQRIRKYKEIRHSLFDECHIVTLTQDQLRDDIDVLKREIWTKGAKIRIDSYRSQGREVSIIGETGYIRAVPGDVAVETGDFTIYEDTHKVLGIHHPLALGDGGERSSNFHKGLPTWRSDDILGTTGLAVTQEISESFETYRLFGEQVSPLRLTRDQAITYRNRFEDLFRDFPDIPKANRKREYQLSFDQNHHNQLCMLRSVITTLGKESVIFDEVETKYAVNEATQLSFPRNVRWINKHNEKMITDVTVLIDLIKIGGVDDKVFLIEGLELADEAPVRKLSRDSPPLVTFAKGGKVVFPSIEDIQGKSRRAPPPSPTTTIRGRLFVVCLLLSVGLIGLLTVRYASRMGSSRT